METLLSQLIISNMLHVVIIGSMVAFKLKGVLAL